MRHPSEQRESANRSRKTDSFQTRGFVHGVPASGVTTRPTNVKESLLQPSSFQNQFSSDVAMLFRPLFLRFLAQQGQSQLQPNALLPFFVLVLCCPLLPIHCPGLCTSIFFTSFRAHTSHVISYLAFEYLSMPMWPLHAQITGLAHHCFCWTPHLSPHLNFGSLICATCPPTPFRPNLGSHRREIFFHSIAKYFHEKRQRGRALLPAAASICLLNFNLSVGAVSTACTLHVLAGTRPADNFLNLSSPPGSPRLCAELLHFARQ